MCARLQLLARGLGALLLEEHVVDVGHDAALRDHGGAHVLVELLIVLDGQLDVPGNNTGLLVLARTIAAQLKFCVMNEY